MDTPIEYRDGRHMSQAVRIGSDLLRQVAEIADKTRTNRADIVAELLKYALKNARCVPIGVLYGMTFDEEAEENAENG